ncbi:MAG: hypothetical protein JWM10_4910 [Myxococcaceae bacterium]|nr:hypothetical protein [Myxococcaceae bacterium]
MRDGRNHGRARWIGALALVGGCGLGNPDLVFTADVGVPPVDTGLDVPTDVGFDAGFDVPADLPLDRPDVPADLGFDVPDLGVDRPDVPTDVGVDAPDVGVDVPDVGVDVPDVPDVVDAPDVPDVPDVPVDMPPVCPAGQTLCGATCFDLAADPSHCGACTTACALPNAVAGCAAGACVVASCTAGFGNCDGNPANGCETSVVADDARCGACTNVCGADRYCTAGACTPSRDCAELHRRRPALPSGTYSLDLDGAGAGAPADARCDMVTDGGGWTLVFDSNTSANYDQVDVGWSRADVAAGLLASGAATEALIAHRDASFVPVPGVSTARFAVPAMWRSRSPFAVAAQDESVLAFLSGSATGETHRLRYGYQNFAGYCGSAWDAGSSFGRICLEGTTAPFFTTFANNDLDYCSLSSLVWYGAGNPVPYRCGAARRFTIYVR